MFDTFCSKGTFVRKDVRPEKIRLQTGISDDTYSDALVFRRRSGMLQNISEKPTLIPSDEISENLNSKCDFVCNPTGYYHHIFLHSEFIHFKLQVGLLIETF